MSSYCVCVSFVVVVSIFFRLSKISYSEDFDDGGKVKLTKGNHSISEKHNVHHRKE